MSDQPEPISSVLISEDYAIPSAFEKELEHLINRHSLEDGSDTPDWILAGYLRKCLDNYNNTVRAREKWYGRKVDNLASRLGLNQSLANEGYPMVHNPGETLTQFAVTQNNPALRRSVQILPPNGSWTAVHFVDLKVGDVFRMYEPWGHPVVQTVDNKQFTVWRCQTLPRIVNEVPRAECVPIDLPTL